LDTKHHGSFVVVPGKDTDVVQIKWTGPPSLVQFRNISIKELP